MEKNISLFTTLEDAVNYYFDYYKENGYPNYNKEDYDPVKEMKKLMAVDADDIIQNGTAKQTMHGCGFLWSFFPHWIDVETATDASLRQNWEDDKKLKNLIEKTIKWCMKHENGKWSTNRIRQNAKVYLSKQAPSNFRPTVAKALYDIYGNGGKVYDPCAGWGGRLMGFLASNCVEYVCCEPSTKTAEGLYELADIYKYLGKKVTIINGCQEDFTPKNGCFDFVFTSPPYFDNERYCNEETQSFIRYKTLLEWRNGFLQPLIYNAFTSLKKGGVFILNIANTKTARDIEEASLAFADAVGFEFKETLKLSLSSIAGKGVKYEPMFVFEKTE